MDWTQTFFQDRVDAAAARSSIRLQTATTQVETVEELPEVVDAGVAPIVAAEPANPLEAAEPIAAKAPD